MKKEDQVCTIEQAKRLYELGIITESTIWWRNDYPANPGKYADRWYLENDYPYTHKPQRVEKFDDYHLLNAFTVAELGEMLPDESGVRGFGSYKNDHLGIWVCEYRDLRNWKGGKTPPKVTHEEEADTEAEARAEMLIYLLENKITTPEAISAPLNAEK